VETVWFVFVSLAIVGFAVTDGFDLGVGMLSLLIGRSEKERGIVRATIAPVWEANQVWLIALGGLLFLAFPRAYAASFSGFYLAFMLLLWCLIGRGLAIELRSHLGEPVWRTACDILLPIASFLVALVLGTAAGNVFRGVPLDAQGRMYLPLWTTMSVKGEPAIFDWYTLFVGLLAVAIFAHHGANYLALRTRGVVRERARRLASYMWLPMAALTEVGLLVTPKLNPVLAHNYASHPLLYVLIGLPSVALAALLYLRRYEHDGAAFAASSVLIVVLIASAAVGLYPNLLPATTDPKNSLTIENAATSNYGLTVALAWFAIGLALVILYTVFVYRLFSRTTAEQAGRY
jgi:cytochrome d ubiquinol oxidase subunit II